MTKERLMGMITYRYGDASEWAELERLALLGLRVEEAPVYVADRREAMWPAEFGVKDGERVRVVEDQE